MTFQHVDLKHNLLVAQVTATNGVVRSKVLLNFFGLLVDMAACSTAPVTSRRRCCRCTSRFDKRHKHCANFTELHKITPRRDGSGFEQTGDYDYINQ